MDHYIDIKLQPDAEMRENVLLNKVYTKFHKALFDLNNKTIGVSFPAYKVLLGRTIRLHSDISMLRDLQGINWLGGLSGYCQISEIAKVPDNVKYRVISRKQSNMTFAKLKRLKARGSITTSEEEKAYKQKMFGYSLDNPYFELESTSNGNQHRRFIQFSDLLDESIDGQFDDFGLSKVATVPWF